MPLVVGLEVRGAAVSTRGDDAEAIPTCMGGESTRGDDAEAMAPPPEPSLAISNGSLDTYPVATHIRSARRCAATASPPWAAAWRVLRVGRTRRATETETPPTPWAPRGRTADRAAASSSPSARSPEALAVDLDELKARHVMLRHYIPWPDLDEREACHVMLHHDTS